MATLSERIKFDLENELYRNYVTDNLQIIGENCAIAVQGSYIPNRFSEIIRGDKTAANDNRTGEQIVLDTIKGAGLEVVNDAISTRSQTGA